MSRKSMRLSRSYSVAPPLDKRGTLYVKVLEARNIRITNFFGKTSNAYCQVLLRGMFPPNTTKVVKKSLDPTWDEEFTFEIFKPDTDALIINVYGTQMTKGHKFIGCVEIPIHDMWAKPPPLDEWFTLKARRNRRDRKTCGDIHLNITYSGEGEFDESKGAEKEEKKSIRKSRKKSRKHRSEESDEESEESEESEEDDKKKETLDEKECTCSIRSTNTSRIYASAADASGSICTSSSKWWISPPKWWISPPKWWISPSKRWISSTKSKLCYSSVGYFCPAY